MKKDKTMQAPPSPSSGGSYRQDPVTGKLVKMEATVVEKQPEAAVAVEAEAAVKENK